MSGDEAQHDDVGAASGDSAATAATIAALLLRLLVRNRDLHLSDTDDVTIPPHKRLVSR